MCTSSPSQTMRYLLTAVCLDWPISVLLTKYDNTLPGSVYFARNRLIRQSKSGVCMWLSNAGILFCWTCYAYIIRKFCTAPDNFTKDLLGLLPYLNCLYDISYPTLNWRTNSIMIIYWVLGLRKIFLLILTCIGCKQKDST